MLEPLMAFDRPVLAAPPSYLQPYQSPVAAYDSSVGSLQLGSCLCISLKMSVKMFVEFMKLADIK